MCVLCIFFFKQKTAYDVRISDWSSDVCSSDLPVEARIATLQPGHDPECLDVVVEAAEALHLYLQFVFAGVAERRVAQVVAQRDGLRQVGEIGRASCRERVCQYVEI